MNLRLKFKYIYIFKNPSSVAEQCNLKRKKKKKKEKRESTPKFNKIQFLVFKISSPIKKKTETFPHLYYLYNKSIIVCKNKVLYV